MLTCKEISVLVTKKVDTSLTVNERFSFFLHTAMCALCRRYAKEMSALHKLMQKTKDPVLLENKKLSEQARERIKQEIDKVLHSTE